METQPTLQEYEQELIGIVRKLPLARVSEVIDFAQFIEFQVAKTYDVMGEDEGKEEDSEGDARWDALLATDESQHLLERMADEAWAEVQEGRWANVSKS